MTFRVELTENGPAVQIPDRSHLGPDQIQSFNELWRRGLGLTTDPLQLQEELDGLWVAARHATGFFRIADVDFEVAPKFLSPNESAPEGWQRALWNILAATEDAPTLVDIVSADVSRRAPIADLLGRVFESSLDLGARRGVPRGYAETTARVPYLRGRLDLSQPLDLALRPDRLTCVFDEFSSDTPVNRLLRWAGEALVSLVGPPALAARIRELVNRDLSGVPNRPPSLPHAEGLVLGIQHRELEPALRVARVLLRSRNLVQATGPADLPGFLWKSSEVFERFVFGLFRRWAKRVSLGAVKHPSVLALPQRGTSSRLTTEPDVRLFERLDHSAVPAILDAKYKVWSGTPKPADRYQVITGAWLARAELAVLVYPDPGPRHRAPITWRTLGTSPPYKLAAMFVDLLSMVETTGRRALIDQIANDIAEISQPPHHDD